MVLGHRDDLMHSNKRLADRRVVNNPIRTTTVERMIAAKVMERVGIVCKASVITGAEQFNRVGRACWIFFHKSFVLRWLRAPPPTNRKLSHWAFPS